MARAQHISHHHQAPYGDAVAIPYGKCAAYCCLPFNGPNICITVCSSPHDHIAHPPHVAALWDKTSRSWIYPPALHLSWRREALSRISVGHITSATIEEANLLCPTPSVGAFGGRPLRLLVREFFRAINVKRSRALSLACLYVIAVPKTIM